MIRLLNTLHQPKGFFYLFFASVCERFSFNGLRAILILYMAKQFLFEDCRSYETYGAFMALTFVTPVLGGWLADQFLGKKGIAVLSIVLCITGFLLLIPPHLLFFYCGLGFLVTGAGFFKSASTTLVGDLYETNDKRQEKGYMIYYIGFNIGAVLSVLVCGAIGEFFSWHYAFLLSALGMIICGCILLKSLRILSKSHPHIYSLEPQNTNKILCIFLISLCIIMNFAFGWIIYNNSWVAFFLPIIGLICLGFIFYIPIKLRQPELWKNMLILFTLIVFHIFFFALYDQSARSVVFFIERNVNRSLEGSMLLPLLSFCKSNITLLPTSIFMVFDPINNLVLGPIFIVIFSYFKTDKKPYHATFKFALGILFMSLSFLLLYSISQFYAENARIAPFWIYFFYTLQGTGELLTAPIGMSLVSRLAPASCRTVLMGIWYTSIAFAQWLSSYLASYGTGEIFSNNIVLGKHQSLEIYSSFFQKLFFLGAGLSIILFILCPLFSEKNPWVNKYFYSTLLNFSINTLYKPQQWRKKW